MRCHQGAEELARPTRIFVGAARIRLVRTEREDCRDRC